MIFAVCPVNIHRIPKVISLLGAMHVVIALPAKESPVQCVKCGEWGHKKENCARRARCYHCSSDKHSFSAHKCEEDDCKDGNPPCPHPPKCIVCNGPHQASYEECPLRPAYSKAKGSIQKASGPEVSRIRGQQKLLRDRLTRDNRMQYELAAQNSVPNTQDTHNVTSVADTQESLATVLLSNTQEPLATASIIEPFQPPHSQC